MNEMPNDASTTDQTDATGAGAGGAAAAGPAAEQMSEDEMRAAYEAELKRITSADMVIQTAVSLLNLGGRRLGLGQEGAEERDLEQVRDAIDAVRGLMPVLERRMPSELGPLRDALAQLQMAFAREANANAAPGASASAPGTAAEQPPTPGEQPSPSRPKAPEPGKPGPAQASGRLWVPGQ